MKNVMVDLETLATTADAVILSIGAVGFEMNGDIDKEGFYASVSVDSNLELGRKISESTLIWWMGQSEAARKVYTEPKHTLRVALEMFQEWILNAHGDVMIWSNGASFDIPMLEHAFKQVDMPPPWKHFNTRCVRTFTKLPGAEKLVRPQLGVAHNALADAMNQALHVQQVHEALFAKRKVTA
jgi:DNA polymerase elongation subunit (family B)